jgi:hypothetical protein
MFVWVFVQFMRSNNLFVMPVCPSVVKEQIGSQRRGFLYMCVSFNFSELIEKTRVSLTFDKNIGSFLQIRYCTFVIIFT